MTILSQWTVRVDMCGNKFTILLILPELNEMKRNDVELFLGKLSGTDGESLEFWGCFERGNLKDFWIFLLFFIFWKLYWKIKFFLVNFLWTIFRVFIKFFS